jgi:hypothetical protein
LVYILARIIYDQLGLLHRVSERFPRREEVKQIEIPVQSAEIMRFKKPMASKPKISHREKVEGEKRQLSLF